MNRDQTGTLMVSHLQGRTLDILKRISQHALLLIGSIIMLIPFLWMISTSLSCRQKL